MSDKEGLFTDKAHEFSPQVNAIPLSDVDSSRGGESIGTLVSNATAQMSTLVRAEIELARTEMIREIKKGALGGGLFGAAGAIALYSTFFFFFFIAALLAVWLPWWAAFLIVFVVMLVLAGALAFLGFKKVKKIGAPHHTIGSAKELKNLRPGSAERNKDHKARGLYT